MDLQAHDSSIQEKGNEALRLLNQIATDMIRRMMLNVSLLKLLPRLQLIVKNA